VQLTERRRKKGEKKKKQNIEATWGKNLRAENFPADQD
jgi:hypothetical protein